MPWIADDAQRHTHKATTPELKELWPEWPTIVWSVPAMKAAQSGKQMPQSHVAWMPAASPDSLWIRGTQTEIDSETLLANVFAHVLTHAA